MNFFVFFISLLRLGGAKKRTIRKETAQFAVQLFITLVLFFIFPGQVQAVCPVCTLVAGVGLGLARWLCIDDTISGAWIGGLVVSSGLWLADYIKKKGFKIPYPEILSVFLFYLFVIPALYLTKLIGLPGNSLWGIDKVILGSISGSIIFLFGVLTDKSLRKINNGRVFIYYQKVILPILYLTILSYIFYLITC